MTTITQVISTAPTAPSWQRPDDFPEEADSFVLYLSGLDTELNTAFGQVNTVAGEININAGIAQTAASTALLTTNTSVYSASTTYAAGDKVLDPLDSYACYTSQQGSNTGHTPNTDDGTWWVKTISLIGIMLKGYGYAFVDKGNSGTTTQTLDYSTGSHQKITATGNFTIALSNFPPTGNLGELLLELVNGGAYTITMPTVNWIKPDGTTTTSISDYLTANTGRTALQTSGTDFILFWSRDGGSTVYGRLC